jgi:undecaprenyl-diphosphatase
MLSYLQAVVIGLLQGVTELFPISSLGHSVLLPAVLGWDTLVRGESANESFYLAFLVGLHVATALVLLAFFRAEWVRIIKGFFSSLRKRRVETADERLAWLLVIATIPTGVVGLVFEHSLRTVFAKPLAAAIFLTLNGLILLGGEQVRRRAELRAPADVRAPSGKRAGEGPEGLTDAVTGGRRLDTLEYAEAGMIGAAQILSLLAGISRSGTTMIAGLLRGLDHEDAARFSFLMATPIILAAGVYKLPDLLGSNGNGIRGQVVVGSLVAGAAAYVSVRFLVRYFQSRNLTPFGIYCVVAGLLCVLKFA